MCSAYVPKESVFVVRKPEDLVPAMHPSQSTLKRTGQVLVRLDDLLVQMCADIRSGRSGVATGKLPRTLRRLFCSRRRSVAHDGIAADGGYGIGRRKRGLIEQGFGKAKFIDPMRQAMGNGVAKVDRVLCW